MNDITRYKIEFSFAPLTVIAVALLATYVTLDAALFWKLVVVALAASAIKPAAEALWSVWWAGGKDDDDDDTAPTGGAPTGFEGGYAPVLN